MIWDDSLISRGDRQAQVSHLGDRQLSLFRGHIVSLFFQKIKQESSVLLAILERGAAQQEVIYVLEEFTQGEMKGEEVPSQSLAKEVGTVPEPLWQNSPGQLLGSMRIWISPGEGKEVIGLSQVLELFNIRIRVSGEH
jgi:hypothetical protein